jgi:hypothetical protein
MATKKKKAEADLGTRVPSGGAVVKTVPVAVNRPLVTLSVVEAIASLLTPTDAYTGAIVRLKPQEGDTDDQIATVKGGLYHQGAAAVTVFPRPRGSVLPSVSKLALVAVPSLREAVSRAVAEVKIPQARMAEFSSLVENVCTTVGL